MGNLSQSLDELMLIDGATAAAVVGAGVLAYVLYRKGRKRQQLEPIEGQARRIGSGEDEGGVASYPRSVRRRRQAAKV